MIKNRISPNSSGNTVGFGNQSGKQTGRLLNKDGSFNVRIVGVPFYKRFSFYHYITNTSWLVFLLLITAGFLVINVLFGLIFEFIGGYHFNGIEQKGSMNTFLELFFFSIQTFTSVGYGRVNPADLLGNIFSSIDSFVGLLYFALVTGLVYGRFSKPRSKLLFSQNAVFSPFKTQTALMFRVANKLSSSLVNAKVICTLSMTQQNADQKPVRTFNTLKIDIDTIAFFPTSWTVVHLIDGQSPLFGMTQMEFNAAQPELFVLLKFYDESFSQETFSTNSYTSGEFLWQSQFKPMLSFEGNGTVMNLGDLDVVNQID